MAPGTARWGRHPAEDALLTRTFSHSPNTLPLVFLSSADPGTAASDLSARHQAPENPLVWGRGAGASPDWVWLQLTPSR